MGFRVSFDPKFMSAFSTHSKVFCRFLSWNPLVFLKKEEKGKNKDNQYKVKKDIAIAIGLILCPARLHICQTIIGIKFLKAV